MISKLAVRVTGGEPTPSEIIKVSGTVSKELRKRLPLLSENTPLLLDAQVGSGKTYAIVHELLPWALDKGLRTLYVSSRVAVNTQVKREIVKETSESKILQHYTPSGLEALKDFNGISVVTYHTLYTMMLYEPKKLREFDILVFDEIHALLEDASYVPYTGYVLYHLKEHFGTKIRIYMSGTCNDILPLLEKIEGLYKLTVLRFSRNFAYIRPYFFRDDDLLIQRINEDHTNQKWLVYAATISHGEAIAAQLQCSYIMLNSAARSQNPEYWDNMLLKRSFDEKVAIATAVVDVGVSFEDRALTNIVVFSTNLNTVVQVLGRKRRKGNETVNLFVWCPEKSDISNQKHSCLQLLKMLESRNSNPGIFMEKYILHPQQQDLRQYIRSDWSGGVHINSLAVRKANNEIAFYEKLLDNAKGSRNDVGFERIILHHLRLRNIDVKKCWLHETSQNAFEEFLARSAGHNMSASAFSEFADKFRDLCVEVYGTGPGGRDRKDRPWGEEKIKKKLAELGGQYRLIVNKNTEEYVLETSCRVMEVTADE